MRPAHAVQVVAGARECRHIAMSVAATAPAAAAAHAEELAQRDRVTPVAVWTCLLTDGQIAREARSNA